VLQEQLMEAIEQYSRDSITFHAAAAENNETSQSNQDIAGDQLAASHRRVELAASLWATARS